MKMKNLKTSSITILICFSSCFVTSGAIADAVTIEYEFQEFDLDTGVISTAHFPVSDGMTGADIRISHNSTREPAAVVSPIVGGVEIVILPNVNCSDINSANVSDYGSSSVPIDTPFSQYDCVLVLSDQGVWFKLSGPTEQESTVTFDYAPL